MNPRELNAISGEIVDGCVTVHRTLGPGLLESAYQACLEVELTRRDLAVRSQVAFPVCYLGTRIDVGYRLDLLVEEEIVVEIKAVSEVSPVHKAQVLSYLRLSGKRLGLLINFNVRRIKEGITRIVNGL